MRNLLKIIISIRSWQKSSQKNPTIEITGFYFLFPDVEAYAGLSGVLHGLYIACAVYGLQFKKERKFALLVIVLVMAKISWENIFGSTQTAELIGSPVLVEAHLLGTIFGVFGALAYMLQHYFQRGEFIGYGDHIIWKGQSICS